MTMKNFAGVPSVLSVLILVATGCSNSSSTPPEDAGGSVDSSAGGDDGSAGRDAGSTAKCATYGATASACTSCVFSSGSTLAPIETLSVGGQAVPVQSVGACI